METPNHPTFLDRILDKLRPVDLHIVENRLAIKTRVELLLAETGLTKAEMGLRIRRDIGSLRSWLAGTRDLTTAHEEPRGAHRTVTRLTTIDRLTSQCSSW